MERLTCLLSNSISKLVIKLLWAIINLILVGILLVIGVRYVTPPMPIPTIEDLSVQPLPVPKFIKDYPDQITVDDDLCVSINQLPFYDSQHTEDDLQAHLESTATRLFINGRIVPVWDTYIFPSPLIFVAGEDINGNIGFVPPSVVYCAMPYLKPGQYVATIVVRTWSNTYQHFSWVLSVVTSS